ncbi:histone deacetylase family protein [Myxococcota bacterium]|nr:histone deacetylase family protein [Myxococcota bacterium]MBU1381128.1 histone deacetylase family protein [Myxococcota bacterium]MBU1496700.1 histone deacetylase family protein [Myxococcota bacterium]
MFRIRRVFDDISPVNKEIISRVQALMRNTFPDIHPSELSELPKRLTNPFLNRFDTILYIAEKGRHRVAGFAILMLDPELGFAFLDWIATGKDLKNRGIGGALYESIRNEVISRNYSGLFYECLQDNLEACDSIDIFEQNSKRLRFYEKYGARPIINTDYELSLDEKLKNGPFLVWDNTSNKVLTANYLKKIVRAILERKYSYLCPTEYNELIIKSIKESPVKLRDYKYIKPDEYKPPSLVISVHEKMSVCLNEKHDIHHIKERGYVEAPVRISSIMKEIGKFEEIKVIESRSFSERNLESVHSKSLLNYLENISKKSEETGGKSFYPYVFPVRNAAREPSDLTVRAGYYCIDTFTPINAAAYFAAKEAVNSTLTAAARIIDGDHFSYALVRPPGHHAESKYFGGFCYFNNNAIATNWLSKHGKVAILDIDYHHGNGQQQIFYKSSNVLTVSIHGHPDFAYPYFSGYEDERGQGSATGFNINFPLGEHITPEEYYKTLIVALDYIKNFNPSFLVVALGFDTAANDPTGTWKIRAKDFRKVGKAISSLGKPVLFVQEGGYRTSTLGINAASFFSGVLSI